MMFKVPESYLTYCTDAAVRTAVDHILDSKSLCLPPDIEWSDLPAFHRAVLSAHQVRCEFAVFLDDVWNAVWVPALENFRCEEKPEPLTVNDAQIWHEQKLDTYTIWAQGWYCCPFTFSDTGFSFGPGVCADTESVYLSLSLWDGDDKECTTDLALGGSWATKKIDAGTVYSVTKLSPIRGDGTIDLEPLHTASADALAAIQTYIWS